MAKKGKIVLLLALSILLVSAPVCVRASSTSINLYIEKEQDTSKKSDRTDRKASKTSGVKTIAVKTGDDIQAAELITCSLTAGIIVYILIYFKIKSLTKKE